MAWRENLAQVVRSYLCDLFLVFDFCLSCFSFLIHILCSLRGACGTQREPLDNFRVLRIQVQPSCLAAPLLSEAASRGRCVEGR